MAKSYAGRKDLIAAACASICRLEHVAGLLTAMSRRRVQDRRLDLSISTVNS